LYCPRRDVSGRREDVARLERRRARHVSLDRIGAMSLVGLAYTLKFAWAPLLDRFRLPWLGRRRGWVLAFQIAVACDNTASAMGTAAFVAFLMTACSPAVSATQFALLTSLSSVGQRVFGPLAPRIVGAIGWSGFFAVCAAMVLPGSRWYGRRPA
jgi:acetyl-CoA transporter-like protein